MKKMLLSCVAFLAFCVFIAMLGCEKTLIGFHEKNLSPKVWLSSGPVEGDTTGYQVHFYWGGWDPDGEVKNYEFVIAAGNPYGFNRADTTGLDKWMSTASHDSVFRVSAKDRSRQVFVGGRPRYTRYDMTHTFFLRAVDLEGKRSPAVYRSFTAWTLAPFVEIDRPPLPVAELSMLGRTVTFGWTGRDPVDSPDNLQDPDSIRYWWKKFNPRDNIIDSLNSPSLYTVDWKTKWISYRAPNDSGRTAIVRDLEMQQNYVFAVQAKDEAGAVTGIFDRKTNARLFVVTKLAGPTLTVTEPLLGGFRFLGINLTPEKRELPPGVRLDFKWVADASEYGGEIVCYQWGWDIADVNDPEAWKGKDAGGPCSPYTLGCRLSAPWYSGFPTLYVRVEDNAGTATIGLIEINVVPFVMDRNLLWVDDYAAGEFDQIDYSMPRESDHDKFWLGFLRKTIGWDEGRDVYDAQFVSAAPPPMALIGRYRNIVWTYNSAPDNGGWDNAIRFTPESLIGTGTTVSVNLLSLFLAKGGHVLTEGISDAGGGLAATLEPEAQIFPMNLRCEIVKNLEGCEGDTSGVNSYPYKDYCVTMLDKITGPFRTDIDMPLRRVRNYDCFLSASKSNDAWHDSIPGMPNRLDLWDVITAPGRFFYPQAPDPKPGGFTLAEVYNPQYWMDAKGVANQRCFHPMYRMNAKNSFSSLNKCAIALFVTKYANIMPEPEVPSGIIVAAPSFHFGFELWYFNPDQVKSIINTIFGEWQILAP